MGRGGRTRTRARARGRGLAQDLHGMSHPRPWPGRRWRAPRAWSRRPCPVGRRCPAAVARHRRRPSAASTTPPPHCPRTSRASPPRPRRTTPAIARAPIPCSGPLPAAWRGWLRPFGRAGPAPGARCDTCATLPAKPRTHTQDRHEIGMLTLPDITEGFCQATAGVCEGLSHALTHLCLRGLWVHLLAPRLHRAKHLRAYPRNVFKSYGSFRGGLG